MLARHAMYTRRRPAATSKRQDNMGAAKMEERRDGFEGRVESSRDGALCIDEQLSSSQDSQHVCMNTHARTRAHTQT